MLQLIMKEVYVVINKDFECIVFETKEMAEKFQRRDYPVSDTYMVQSCIIERDNDLQTIMRY